jgi:urease accessory protein
VKMCIRKSKSANPTLAIAICLTSVPSLVLAHTGHSETAGFIAGFSHPFSGLDHILTMLFVGVLAAMIGARTIWAAPVTFLIAMAAGGITGMSEITLPLLEMGLFASVLVTGAMLFRRLRPPITIVLPIIGAAGFVHGFAHGSEMPANSEGLLFASGFLSATTALIVVGIVTARLLNAVAASRSKPVVG